MATVSLPERDGLRLGVGVAETFWLVRDYGRLMTLDELPKMYA
jgi:hypothetical protein